MLPSALAIVEVVSALLTCVGVILALRSLRDARKLTSSLRVIEELASTRVIGKSPDFIAELTNLVKQARHSLQITSVYPTYGFFSSPLAGQELENAVILARRNPEIRIEALLGSLSARRAALRAQYEKLASGPLWSTWSQEPKSKALLEAYCDRYAPGKTFSSFEELVGSWLDEQEKKIPIIYSEKALQFTDDFMPLHSWVIDEREAFFAIVNSEGRTTGFYTREQNLIGAFSSANKRYKTRSDNLDAAVLT
jgi:hypothetical protein